MQFNDFLEDQVLLILVLMKDTLQLSRTNQIFYNQRLYMQYSRRTLKFGISFSFQNMFFLVNVRVEVSNFPLKILITLSLSRFLLMSAEGKYLLASGLLCSIG